MPGTGLPIPQTGVLAQGPGVMDGDRISTASAWAQIARSGARLAEAGFDAMEVQKAGYLADLETEARTKRIELQNANAFNPNGFQAAWKGFTDGKLGSMAPGLVDHMRKVYGGEGNSAYGSILNDKTNQDRTLAGQSLTARRKGAIEDVLGLAAGGRMGTPEFHNALATMDGVGETMANSGFVSKDELDYDRQGILAKAAGEGILYNADKLYAEKGYEAALKETDSLLTDPKSGLSPAEQRSYFEKTRSRLAVRETARREDLKEVRALAEPTIKLLREGVDGVEGDGETLAKRFDTLGSPSDAARMRNAIEFNRGFRGILSNPTREWRNASFIDKMTNAESGGDPNADNPRSSALGQHQFTEGTWLGTVEQHRPDLMQGRTREQVLALRTDPALSREMAGYHAADNAAALRNAGFQVTDGTQYLAWFAGIGGATDILRADPGAPIESILQPEAIRANPFLRGKSAADVVAWADKKMGDGAARSVDPAMLAGRRAGAQRVFDEWMPKAKVNLPRWGVQQADVEFINAMRPYLDEKRSADLSELMTSGAMATVLSQMPPDARTALMSSLEARAADGDAAARTFLVEGEDLRKELEEKERTDPLGRARDAGWIGGPTTVDWGQGQDVLTATLTARSKDAAVTADRLGQSVVPALRDGEARSLASALTTGPAERALPVIASMQGSMPADQFSATMALKPVQDALGVMARSGDVKRMTAAFSAYDALYRANPAEFEAKFTKSAIDQLQTWQGKLQFYSPEEVADYMRRADDPATLAAREKLQKDGAKLVETVTADDVAGKMGTWLSTPGLSPDPVRNEAMAVEYRRLYAERYADTGDANTAEKQALERLGNKWGVSSVNRGQLTVRPPERYYPAIRGSHDWMREDLEAAVRAAGGAEGLVQAGPRGPVPTGAGASATAVRPYSLVADAETEADIAAGRPPSYVVWITDRNGQMKVPEAGGKAMRFRWDGEAALENSRAWARRTEDFMTVVRRGQAIDRELNPRQFP